MEKCSAVLKLLLFVPLFIQYTTLLEWKLTLFNLSKKAFYITRGESKKKKQPKPISPKNKAAEWVIALLSKDTRFFAVANFRSQGTSDTERLLKS